MPDLLTADAVLSGLKFELEEDYGLNAELSWAGAVGLTIRHASRDGRGVKCWRDGWLLRASTYGVRQSKVIVVDIRDPASIDRVIAWVAAKTEVDRRLHGQTYQ